MPDGEQIPDELHSALVSVLDEDDEEPLTSEEEAALQAAVDAGEITIEDAD